MRASGSGESTICFTTADDAGAAPQLRVRTLHAVAEHEPCDVTRREERAAHGAAAAQAQAQARDARFRLFILLARLLLPF